MDQLTLSCPACEQPVGKEDLYCEACGARLHLPGAAGALDSGRPAGHPPSPGPAAPSPATANGSTLPPRVGAPGPAGAGPQGPVLPQDPRAGQAPAGGTGDFVLAAPAQPGTLLETETAESDLAEDITGLGAGASGPAAARPGQDDSALETTSASGRTPAAGPQPTCAHCGAQRIDADGYCEACGRPLPRPRDHQERALESIAGVSDRGFRHHRNEDAFSVAATRRPNGSPAVVAVVCDGVSSSSHPDAASELASECGTEHLLSALESGTAPEEATTAAILAAADAVDALADRTPREPGHNSPACTCVSAVAADGRVTIGWVGDSRAYWFPDDRSTPSERLTLDDSWATRMIEAGLLEAAEAYADPRAHAITGWLGADAVEVEPHVEAFVPDAPGVVLVCTDGLWNYAEGAEELAAVVPADARARPLEAARELVSFALENGGHDNITVAILPWDPAYFGAGPEEIGPEEIGPEEIDTDAVDTEEGDTEADTGADADATMTLPNPDRTPTEFALPVLDPSENASAPTPPPARPSHPSPSPRSPEEP